MSGRKTFTAGEVLQAADVNDFLMDQSVMVFAGTAARGSAIPSPSEGMVTYLEDSNSVEVFDGSSFVAVGPGQILQVVNASTTTGTTITATSFADTAITATITPTSASSTILILGQVCMLSEGSGVQAPFTVFRGNSATGTNLGNGANGLGRVSGDGFYNSIALTVSDSPATTSATTYTFATNRIGGTQVRTSINGQKSTMTLIEVAG